MGALQRVCQRAIRPLAAFAGAVWLDHLMDIQSLSLPVLVALVVCVGVVLTRIRKVCAE